MMKTLKPMRTMGRNRVAAAVASPDSMSGSFVEEAPVPRKPSAFMKRLARIPLATVMAPLYAVSAAVLVMAIPHWLFEYWVARTGLPSILPMAAPPLGGKAQLAVAIVAALGAGAATWLAFTFGTRLLGGKSKVAARKRPIDTTVADIPLSARKRSPIFAENELGSPLMSEEALAVGNTLSTPMSDADGDALLLQQAIPPFAEPLSAPQAPVEDDDVLLLDMAEPVDPPINFRDWKVPDYQVPEPGFSDAAAEVAPVTDVHAPHADAFAAIDQPAEEVAKDASLTAMMQRLEFGVARMAHDGRKPVPPSSPEALFDRVSSVGR